MTDTPVFEDTVENIIEEGNLIFHFPSKAEKLDKTVPAGLMSVDFAVYGEDCLYLIEVKDYEHPKATTENKNKDYKMLTDPEAAFPLEIGMKVKDTLLRKFSEGMNFDKKVIFLLVIKSEKLQPGERNTLYESIKTSYIPTGINGNTNFKHGIKFDMPTLADLERKYKIEVSEKI
jgi:hypothetical protein